jgi:PhoPQ-activated pathogenicity-related protein
MKNNKSTFISSETQEQKEARWAKQSKAAKTFAKSVGVNWKKISEDRRRDNFIKDHMSLY